jgi:hypothetical protein
MIQNELTAAWGGQIEARVREIVEKDSSELKKMVRMDLKRLETLMVNTFEDTANNNRRSLSEIPSLR